MSKGEWLPGKERRSIGIVDNFSSTTGKRTTSEYPENGEKQPGHEKLEERLAAKPSGIVGVEVTRAGRAVQ
ncbi:MAG: hypothetical protein KKE36_07960 [Actinobacteria bacterium]|nr:hypothetical protein [Actinomycetota bacterium]